MVLRFLETELRFLSHQIGLEWQELATRLGFNFAEIQQLKSNHIGDVANAIFQMLVRWQEQLDPSCSDSMSALGVILKKVGRADLEYAIISRNGFRGTTNLISSNTLRVFSELTDSARTDEPDIQNINQSVPPVSSNRWGHQPHSAQGGSLIQTQGANNTTILIGANSNVKLGAQAFALPGAGSQNYGVQSGSDPTLESSGKPLITTRGESNTSVYIGSNTRADIRLPDHSNSTASSAQTGEVNQERSESASNFGMDLQQEPILHGSAGVGHQGSGRCSARMDTT